MSQEQKLDISWEAIGKLFIVIALFYIVYRAREIALWFLFGLSLSVLLEPAILFLRKIKIPKIIAIVMTYFSIFGLLGLLIYITAPIFMYELKQFSQYLPNYINEINPILDKLGINAIESYQDLTSVLMGGLEQSSKGIVNAVMAFFGGISSTVIILTISFFLSMEDKGAERFLTLISPRKYEEKIAAFFEMAQGKVAGWFGARILACLFIGIASFIVYYLFGIKYAFILALIGGVLNFVPYIGPLITAALLIVFVAVSSGSWLIALYCLLSVMVIQAVENNLLTPLLMKKLIDIPPVLVILSLLVGAKLFGFLGAIFAVPAFGIIFEFSKEILERRKEEAT